MKAAMALAIGAVALLLIVAIAFTVMAVQIPAMQRARVAAQTVNTAQWAPVQGPFDPPPAVLYKEAAGPQLAVSALIATLVFGTLLIAVFAGFLLRRQPIRRARDVSGQLEVEETRMMQEIYRSLERMDRRIESLETILLDRPKMSEPFGRGD